MNRTLVTGAAGFIGYHYSLRLLQQGKRVTGVDNLNDYYSVQLKTDRLQQLLAYPNFTFKQIDLANRSAMEELFRSEIFERVVHLAAQAGVRYSITNPHVYVESNLVGFINILEGCRFQKTPHLVYASSSSVYGSNTKQPFATTDSVDHPISLYAATKKANELMAHTYSHLYDLPTTGLRFFTVYGPWGRPDMAMWIFAKAIAAGEPIRLFNHGKMQRDFTYVDDVVESIERLVDKPPAGNPAYDGNKPDPASSSAPWRVYNIGNNNPVDLLDVVDLLEKSIGKKAIRELAPMQPGDVPATYANVDDLMRDADFRPATPIADGIAKFIEWYRAYHRL